MSDEWFDGFMDWTETWVMQPMMVVLVATLIAIPVVGGYFGISYWRESRQNDPLTQGVVLEKNYSSAYTSTVFVGKMLVPQYHPEVWSLRVQGMTSKRRLIKQEDVTLPKDAWERVNIGDTVNIEQ